MIACLMKDAFDKRAEKTPIIIGEIVIVSGINSFVEKFKDQVFVCRDK